MTLTSWREPFATFTIASDCRAVDQRSIPVVIVGGGLSGWIAAAYLGRRQVPTLVINDTDVVGGRAWTFTRDGFHFNFGPHRLFGGGAAVAGLRELGIPINAASRGPNGGLAICHGRARQVAQKSEL